MEQINVSKSFEISKEIENINFNELLVQFPELKTSKYDIRNIIKRRKPRRWFLKPKVNSQKKIKEPEPKTQLIAFQQAMKWLLIAGQCLGLNPVSGLVSTDVSKMRFSVFNWKFIYGFTSGFLQAIGSILILYRLTKIPLSVGAVGFFIFYVTTCVTTFLFLNLGSKWPGLMKELANVSLDEYIDPSMKFKCYASCAIVLMAAVVEHTLSLISKFTSISDCNPNVRNIYEEYQRRSFAFWYDLVPISHLFEIFMQITTVIFTMIWNYSDLFIVCISFFLVSILKEINKKIIWASERPFLPSNVWKSLREDYSRATRLVRSFDAVITEVLFISFASNVFFICLQIFNILDRGLKLRQSIACPNVGSGVFAGYEYTVYVVYSAMYLLGRSLTVSLIAAGVHSASLVPATALYNVPSTSFCLEVERFLNQVHTNTVALSGLKYFYVTRELVLSVAGTIVTYELVVLQVSGDED